MSLVAGSCAVVSTSFAPVLAGALTGFAALLAVLLSQRGERCRAQEDRLWQQRVLAYTELVVWADEVNAWSLGRKPRTAQDRPSVSDLVGRDLHARLLVYAGPDVRRWLEATETELECLPPEQELAIGVHTRADALLDAVQQELLHMRVRTHREGRRLGVGQCSLRDLGRGAGPRYRR